MVIYVTRGINPARVLNMGLRMVMYSFKIKMAHANLYNNASSALYARHVTSVTHVTLSP